MTTIKLINMSITSCSSHFSLCVVRTLKIYSLSKFQVYDTVFLTVVTMLYIRSPELIHLITESLYLWTNTPHFPPSPPLATTILFFGSMSSTFLDSTYK